MRIDKAKGKLEIALSALAAAAAVLSVFLWLQSPSHSGEGFREKYTLTVFQPAILVERKIVAILGNEPFNLSVVSNESGWLVTDYEEYQGEQRGLLWWTKRYRERSRYILHVYPEIGQPEFSLVEVRVESEKRPNGHYPWEHCVSILADSRAAHIANEIGKQLEGRNI